jgi:type 1 glutamine amidotransferase
MRAWTALCAWLPLAAAAAAPAVPPAPRVVFMIGENEYQTWDTLPAFAQVELAPPGYTVAWVRSSNREGDPHFAGAEALADADLLVLSVRRRTPPTEVLERVRDHLRRGRPLVALRTASHPFALRRGAPPTGHADWPDFDRAVLGARYLGHLGPGQTQVEVNAEAARHPLLADWPTGFTSSSTLYQFAEVSPAVTVLLHGRSVASGERQPLAWTHRPEGGSRVFYTSLGGPEDFAQPAFRALLRRAIAWGLYGPSTPP